MDTRKEGQKLQNSQDTIVVFTSNFTGGILQFAKQLSSTLYEVGFDTVIYVPDNSHIIEANDRPIKVVKFQKQKSISLKSKSSKSMSREIEKLNPILVLFADATIISSQVLLSLQNTIPTAIFIHDVTPHPEKSRLYETLKRVVETRNRRHALQKANRVILLSENSFKKFKSIFRCYSSKAVMMPLGAHVPIAEHTKPPEFDDLNAVNYYLFFGRITKYKGIKQLLQAYQGLPTVRPLLVIAGDGELQQEEKELVANNSDVVLINRYIEDGEMLYLIKNCLTVVLPYIEASQSGVLPIAYHFGVPVITSNVAGLVEFVENGVTGIISNDVEEMARALMKMRNQEYRNYLGNGAYEFYRERMDWSTNLMHCLDPLVPR